MSDVREAESGEGEEREDKCEQAELENQSREPALTYIAQSNPTFRDRLSLEVASGSDHPMCVPIQMKKICNQIVAIEICLLF